MTCTWKTIVMFVGVATLTAVASAQPTITWTSAAERDRSGRVAIEGTGFGASGQVLIAGIESWTSTWTDTRVVAYVPEQAPPGPTTLRIVAGGQPSNDVALTVTPRQPDGRVRWRFETDGDNMWFRPAVAPDGTIYIHQNNDTDGLVYALAPDGALRWIQTVNWFPAAPPGAGPDNAVYVSSIDSVYRIAPDGTIDWTFNGQDAEATPAIGPDGMLYGGFESAPGAFQIEPATGELQWSHMGDPGISAWPGGAGTEIRFGRSGPGQPIDRFYVAMNVIWAFDFDGDQLWAGGTPNVSCHDPAIGADGTLYSPGYNEAYLVAQSPDDGSILWLVNSPWLAHISEAEIGADDALYFISDSTRVEAYDPHTQSSIWRTNTAFYLDRPSLSPDGSTLVVAGGGSQDQLPVIKGFDPANGHELWHINIQDVFDPAFRILPIHHARISDDSTTAYLPTLTLQWPFPDGDDRAYLYAIDIGDGTPPDLPGDANGDGRVNVDDIVMIVTTWGPCPGPPVTCDADVDSSGQVDIDDITLVVLNWS